MFLIGVYDLLMQQIQQMIFFSSLSNVFELCCDFEGFYSPKILLSLKTLTLMVRHLKSCCHLHRVFRKIIENIIYIVKMGTDY